MSWILDSTILGGSNLLFYNLVYGIYLLHVMSYTLDIGLYSKRVPVFPKKSSPNSSTLAMHLILKKNLQN